MAIRKLQAAIGVADDGHWGPYSKQTISFMELNDVLLKYNAQRLRFYTSLKNRDRFLAGWVNRVADNLDYAAKDN